MKIDRTRTRRSTGGFTLLELLLVMAILVVLASLSTFAILNMQQGAYQQSAFTEIQTLEDACTMYKLKTGAFPSELNDLFQPPSGMTQVQWGGPYLKEPVDGDPWSRPYNYMADETQNRVTITSNGPDGKQGTEDDVPGPTGQ
jgi:general secretion pathway protein G